MAYDNFLIDKRVVERNIAKGLVDSDELKRHIESLPDRESNCVHVSLDGSAGQEQTREETAATASESVDVDDGEVDDGEGEPEGSELGD